MTIFTRFSNWLGKKHTITIDPKRVIVGTLAAGILLVVAIKWIDAVAQGIREHNELQKSPIIRLWSEYDDVKSTLIATERILSSNAVNSIEVTRALENLEEYKEYFNPKYFTNTSIDSLRQLGLQINNNAVKELQSMNQLYQRTVVDLRTAQKELGALERAEQNRMTRERKQQEEIEKQHIRDEHEMNNRGPEYYNKLNEAAERDNAAARAQQKRK